MLPSPLPHAVPVPSQLPRHPHLVPNPTRGDGPSVSGTRCILGAVPSSVATRQGTRHPCPVSPVAQHPRSMPGPIPGGRGVLGVADPAPSGPADMRSPSHGGGLNRSASLSHHERSDSVSSPLGGSNNQLSASAQYVADFSVRALTDLQFVKVRRGPRGDTGGGHSGGGGGPAPLLNPPAVGFCPPVPGADHAAGVSERPDGLTHGQLSPVPRQQRPQSGPRFTGETRTSRPRRRDHQPPEREELPEPPEQPQPPGELHLTPAPPARTLPAPLPGPFLPHPTPTSPFHGLPVRRLRRDHRRSARGAAEQGAGLRRPPCRRRPFSSGSFRSCRPLPWPPPAPGRASWLLNGVLGA